MLILISVAIARELSTSMTHVDAIIYYLKRRLWCVWKIQHEGAC